MIKEDSAILNKVIYKRSLTARIIYFALQILTVATLIAVIVYYARGERDIASSPFIMQVVMCSLALIFFNTLLILERIFKFFIPNYLLIGASAFVFVNCILGNVFQLFNTQNGVFDKILHVATGIIFTLFALSVVNMLNNLPKIRWKMSPFFVVIFCFCFSMMIAVLWEIFEYMLDVIQPNLNMQRWKDSFVGEVGSSGNYLLTDPKGSAINDTVWDMICNVIGSVVTCVYCYFKIDKHGAGWIIKKSILTPKQQKILIDEQKKILQAQHEIVLNEVKPELEKKGWFSKTFTTKRKEEDKSVNVKSTTKKDVKDTTKKEQNKKQKK